MISLAKPSLLIAFVKIDDGIDQILLQQIYVRCIFYVHELSYALLIIAVFDRLSCSTLLMCGMGDVGVVKSVYFG